MIIFLYALQTNSDFDAKPMILLLGQYSTGKTTFIKHMLRTNYPGKWFFNLKFYVYNIYLKLLTQVICNLC